MSPLEEAHGNGRWSFAVRPTTVATGGAPFVAGNLLYVNMSPWAARQWTINLCRMRFAGGPLPFAGQPPDNQVDTSPRYRARILWGVDGALDTALVDYPWGGCTIGVTAAMLQVDILADVVPVGTAAPQLAGFLTPSANVITTVTAPLYTVDVAVPANTQVTVNLPARCSGYRVTYFQAPLSAINVFSFLEVDNTGALVQDDGFSPGVVGVERSADSQSNRSGYIVTHPRAVALAVLNTSLGAINRVTFSFLLDLG